MVYIWYHVPHTIRCCVGLYLYTKIPRSHQMAQNMSIPSTLDNMQFADIMHYIKLAGRDAVKDF